MTSLCFASVLLLLAIVIALFQEKILVYLSHIGLHQKESSATVNDPYSLLGPSPQIDPPYVFSAGAENLDAIIEAYVKDGVVAVRGLLDNNLLLSLDQQVSDLINATRQPDQRRDRRHTQFRDVIHGAMFRSLSLSNSNADASPLWHVAVGSTVSSLAAKLLKAELRVSTGNNSKSLDNLRVMRDILLTKDDDEYVCGWHVDDLGFWPAAPESSGINAWIALDDMPTERGGGFALAVGSHHDSEWRAEAHWVTGASSLAPPGGYQSALDMLEKRTGSGTCNLQRAAPHLHRRMEEIMRVYPINRGDVVFHTRWLFHRTVPFHRGYVNKWKEHFSRKDLLYRRYSIRYSPGSAQIPPGYGMEWSVLWNNENGGRTADEVSQADGPWYPQAWPVALPFEKMKLSELVDRKFPIAEKHRSIREIEMKRLLQQWSETK